MRTIVLIVLSLWIVYDDIKSMEINLIPLVLWLILHIPIHFQLSSSFLVVLLFLLFNLMGVMGFGDTLLVLSFVMDNSIERIMVLLSIASITGIIVSNIKKESMLPFTPFLLFAYWVLLVIQMID